MQTLHPKLPNTLNRKPRNPNPKPNTQKSAKPHKPQAPNLHQQLNPKPQAPKPLNHQTLNPFIFGGSRGCVDPHHLAGHASWVLGDPKP